MYVRINFQISEKKNYFLVKLENYSYQNNNLILYELKLLTSEDKLILSKDTKGNPLSLSLKINNVTDENYEQIVGYPGLPRQAFLGLNYKF